MTNNWAFTGNWILKNNGVHYVKNIVFPNFDKCDKYRLEHNLPSGWQCEKQYIRKRWI